MAENPWVTMTIEDARAYDERKERGAYRNEIAVKRAIIRRMIQGHLPTDRSAPVLDLGGGTGIWTIPLARNGYHVYLTDISPGFLACAREKLVSLGLSDRVTVVEADIVDLSVFAEGSFPLVLALGDPLSYCTDAGRALAEMRRVTARGGTLIGDVESRYGGIDDRRATDWYAVRRILRDGIAQVPGADPCFQVRLFTPTELQTEVQSAGWEAVGMYPSDLLSRLLAKEFADSIRPPDGAGGEWLQEWIDIEEDLRRDPHLLGCGKEIQFVLRNP